METSYDITFGRTRSVTKTFSSGGGIGNPKKVTVALDDASIAISTKPATVIAIAGESGSGKATLSRLILGLISPSEGDIYYRGKPLSQMSHAERMTFGEVQAIFQDPFEVYNPFYKIDHALTMPIESFEPKMPKAQARKNDRKCPGYGGLACGRNAGSLSPSVKRWTETDRVMVARALLLNPSIIVADEPVSMVDASLTATILESLLKAHKELGASLIYITHDLPPPIR